MSKDMALIIGVSILAVTLPIAVWIASSSAEARAFNRLTGESVSTWDAMFVELRIEGNTED